MEQAQLIQAAASIAGGMAAAHYDKFSGLVAARITEIAETAVKLAKARCKRKVKRKTRGREHASPSGRAVRASCPRPAPASQAREPDSPSGF